MVARGDSAAGVRTSSSFVRAGTATSAVSFPLPLPSTSGASLSSAILQYAIAFTGIDHSASSLAGWSTLGTLVAGPGPGRMLRTSREERGRGK